MSTRPKPPQPVLAAAPAARPRPARERQPSRGRGKDSARPEAGARRAGSPVFHLAIGRDGIGLELAEPAEIGCLRVVELSTSLPGMRFPVDVSGGVARFRHRRGELRVLRVEIGGRDLEAWAAPRLRGLVGTRTPDVWIEVGRAKSTVCVAALADAEEATARDLPTLPALAFDVHALAEGEDVVLVASRPRGVGLPEPAMAMAIACLQAALGASAERRGAVFTVRRPAGAIARALMPDAGARAPGADEVRWAALSADGGTWVLHAAHGSDPAGPTEDAVRAREVATLLAAADDALVAGDVAGARGRYMETLERAPRHAEIAARVAEIDARAPARAEAALATLVESRAHAHAAHASIGLVAGQLLAQVGDLDAAMASFERAGETEVAPALSGRAFELAAQSSRDAEISARWLDRALARAPRSTRARWSRVEARLALGRLEDALADAEHLEALARGTRAKFAVWLRAGRAWVEAGLGAHAGAVFERALRYAPEDPGALAGLGTALVGEGRAARGVALLERAVQVARARGEDDAALLLQLGRALAERLDDLPTAIAHVALISAAAPEAAAARGLEGRWRARLGDAAGAALAFARLRDLAASLAAPAGTAAGATAAEAVVAFLLEAAALERDTRRDPLAAQRHLAAALRLSPHHADARRAYREAGAMVLRASLPAEGPGSVPDEAIDEDIDPEEPALERALRPFETAPALSAAPVDLALPVEDVEGTARAEELMRRLRDAPGDDAMADELAALLEDLGRGHDLVALIAGRMEDASPDRRMALAPGARGALERMAARAEAEGRHSDASLFRDALSSIVGLS